MPERRKAGVIFLLSPANLAGVRGGQLLSPRSRFALALRLREEGAPLGELFSFVSALYFRGKLTYATRFSSPAPGRVWVITSNRGLMAPDAVVTAADLAGFAGCDLDPTEPRYADPLRRDLGALPPDPVVLLGSVATGKYLEVLRPVLGPRLVVPARFVGLGDMSRGALLLAAARSGRELAYRPAPAPRRTKRRPARP